MSMKMPTAMVVLGMLAALGTASCVTEFEGCDGGETECTSGCTDLMTDESNCGTCGHACNAGETCESGLCTPPGCGSGETDCSGTCVNLQSDPDHCGSCDHACSDGEVCDSGSCSTDCSGGLTNCDGSCVDLSGDEDHCGTCDISCDPGETCTDGTCTGSSTCEEGFEDCSGTCVDLMNDQSNCGSCGRPCTDAEMCMDGDCVCADGYGACDGGCEEDSDGDGVGDGCDPCPGDNPDDTDGDGVCDSDDICPGLPDESSILNPGFTTPDHWVVSGGALVNTTAAGMLDVGEAFLTADAVCAGGELMQTICVPGTFETMGPMVLALFARNASCSDPFYCGGVAGVRFNGHFQQVADYLDMGYVDEMHMCLGEAAYGGPVDLALTASGLNSGGTCDVSMTASFAYDNLALADAPENLCPGPGTVLNGRFEDGDVGWETVGQVAFEDDGSGSNNWARLDVPSASCGAARMYGKLSQPLQASMPGTALRFRYWGTPSWGFYITVNGASVQETYNFDGTGSWRTQTFCLDPENQGVVYDVEVHLPFPGGACATQPYRYLYVDDMTIVSSPGTCS